MRRSLYSLCEQNSGVCIGLDPDMKKLPSEFSKLRPKEQMKIFVKEIVDITSKIACAYKIQKAFFDLYSFGPDLLKKTIDYIRKKDPKIPVIIDSKIGDIDNTMEAYLNSVFYEYHADAVTINPYMGGDVFESFKKFPDRGAAVLYRTSNKSASEIQDIIVKIDGQKKPMWRHIMDVSFEKWNPYNNIVPVLSGYANLEGIRKKIGEDVPILYAGVGAQGGNVEPIKEILNNENSGVFINSSRGILYPYEKNDKNWREKVYDAAVDLYYKIENMKKNGNK